MADYQFLVDSTLDLTVDDTGLTATVGLPASGVTVGAYYLVGLSVDAQGRIVSAEEASLSSDFSGDGSSGSPLSLSVTGATAGSYTLTSLTVDSKGRISSVSSATAIDGIVIGGSAPAAGSFTALSASAGIIASNSTTDTHFSIALNDSNYNQITSSGAYASFGIYGGARERVAAGVTNSVGPYGLQYFALRNNAGAGDDDDGTSTYLTGAAITYGNAASNAAATPQISNAYGLVIAPYSQTGTIANAYDIYLSAEASGGTVTNPWGVFQANTKANFLQNILTVKGTTADSSTDVLLLQDSTGTQILAVDSDGKIDGATACPGSFADLAAVHTFLSAVFN